MEEKPQPLAIKEGSAKIQLNGAFYNNIQEFNRDMSIAVINNFSKSFYPSKKLKILEALSATGLRSVRYGI